jgi:glycosyltransferase involved in cell wall biosynthesis
MPQPPATPRATVTALVAGFDLRFAEELVERLGNRTDLAVTVDPWPELGRGGAQTEALLDRAGSIFAEWARTSAVWYSRRKRPDQFLVVRLHRFELDAPYPRQIAMENVDAVVYIAPLFGRRIRDELGWPQHKLVYIPNFLDVDWLDRPKLADARFALGFVGIEWSRKRLDLALDLLAALRRQEHRFHLVVRSVMPWQNAYAWAEAAERDYVAWCFDRIERDPLLRDAVVFDPPGRDIARWFRRIGHVLSTSDAEGSHTALSEGMASGAVPVVRPWPGAAELYDKEWIHASTADAAAAVLANVDAAAWADRAGRARAEVRRSHDPAAVVAAWADLLHRDVAAARAHFAEYVSP